MDFASACAEAAMIPELVENYNRLFDRKFLVRISRSPIEAMIDKAVGHDDIDKEEVFAFADFFYEYVWSRLPEQCFANQPQQPVE